MTCTMELRSLDELPPDGTRVLVVRERPDERFEIGYVFEGYLTGDMDGCDILDAVGWLELPDFGPDLLPRPSYPVQLSGAQKDQ